MYRHIVLFKVHDHVADSQVADALTKLRSLGGLAGVVSWRVELSIDPRKGRVIVQDGTFADATAFDQFRQAPEHVEVGSFMARISDWWIGDYRT